MSVAAGNCGGCLRAVLAGVWAHRRCAGRPYSLRSLLLIAVAAMLAGRQDQLGIVW